MHSSFDNYYVKFKISVLLCSKRLILLDDNTVYYLFFSVIEEIYGFLF